MSSKWSELRPGSDLTEDLSFLHDEALRLLETVRTRRQHERYTTVEIHVRLGLIHAFRDRVRGREDVLGAARVTRILATNNPETTPPELNNPHNPWDEERLSRLIVNLEFEKDTLDRDRVLWTTVFTAVTSLVAAVLAAVAVIIGIVSLLRHS